MDIKKIAFLALTAPILLTSCTNTEGGTLLGGATGALIGSRFGGGSGQVLGTAVGVMAGALIGNKIGASMDETDRLRANQVTNQALETSRTGATSTWRNPDSGHSGSVTPRKTFTRRDGKQCREYTQTVTIGGKTQQAYGTACRQEDGTWLIVS